MKFDLTLDALIVTSGILVTGLALTGAVMFNVITDPNTTTDATNPTTKISPSLSPFEQDIAACESLSPQAASDCYSATIVKHGLYEPTPDDSLPSPSYDTLPGEIESLPRCMEEDGSGKQSLPCLWDGGNDPDISLRYIVNPDFSVAMLPPLTSP